MGLSRNKVAVSEGAAGSPPFYGECGTGRSEITPDRICVEQKALYLLAGKHRSRMRKNEIGERVFAYIAEETFLIVQF